jgi:choline dehydrogenase
LVGQKPYDVAVVGAGSSGGAVAARLSENPERSVLLLEAGPDFPDERGSPPAFLTGGNVLGEGFAGAGAPVPELDWNYLSEPVAGGRRVHLRRGRMVGGTSMINGCVAVRGAPRDYDRWQELGARGWGWTDVRPVFERVERAIPIKRYRQEQWQPIQHAFVDAFEELGYRREEDLNDPGAWEGVVGAWPQNRRNEIRQGTLVTYLREARGRPNLEIRARTLVDRIVVRNGTARAVRVISDGAAVEEVEAGTVVLSAGAYGSPAILLRSGIGPAAELRALGIECVVELPVGRRLMDHPQCVFTFRAPPELASMSGPGFAVVARGDGWWSFPLALDEEEGICAFAFGLASEDASGTVKLASPGPKDAPLIDHRYRDVIERGEFTGAFSTFRELLASATLLRRGAWNGDTSRPLDEILGERLGTAFHPAGTCAMGAVVDETLRVYGVEGLVVADASVFPAHVTNNPNLTCLMLGERAAELLSIPA